MAGRGRPKKQMNDPTKRNAKITKDDLVKAKENRKYVCNFCGKESAEPSGVFYRNESSPLFKQNSGYATICKECIANLFEKISNTYGSDKIACIMICHYLDFPFYNYIFDAINGKNLTFSLGLYIRRMNNAQVKGKTFLNSIASGELLKSDDVIKEEREDKWTVSDLKNKTFVIKSIGYDCFDDDSYTDEDRRFLFNTLSAYLVDDVLDDPHRAQSAIRMVKTMLQSAKIDSLINEELASNDPSGNLKAYTDAKDKLDRNINQAASDNGFSLKNGNKSLHNSNTLTGIMKEMVENDFEDIKVNSFDVKMSEAFQQIADISNKSILAQLNFQSDDYARMVAMQRNMIQDYEKELSEQQEKNRLLMIELEKLKEIGGEE